MKFNISQQRTGFLLAILAAFGFSFKAIFVKLAYISSSVNATTLLMLRMLFSLPFIIFLMPTVFRRGGSFSRNDYLLVIFLGITGYYGSSMLDFMGLQYISAGLERIILCTYPILTVLISVILVKKKIGVKFYVAMVLSYTGIAIAFVHDVKTSSDNTTFIYGCILVFLGAVCYAVYSAGSESAIKSLGALKFAISALFVSIVTTAFHFMLTEPLSSLILPVNVYFYSAGMALFSTIMPVFLLSSAIQRIGAPHAVLIGLLGPVLTIFFSWWLLDEDLSVEQIIGTGMVIISLIILSRK